jgi:hypothetical protein
VVPLEIHHRIEDVIVEYLKRKQAQAVKIKRCAGIEEVYLVMYKPVDGKIETFPFQHNVNVSTQECSCNVWQRTGLPCWHAAGAFTKTKRPVEKVAVASGYTLRAALAVLKKRLPKFQNHVAEFSLRPVVLLQPPTSLQQPSRKKRSRKKRSRKQSEKTSALPELSPRFPSSGEKERKNVITTKRPKK